MKPGSIYTITSYDVSVAEAFFFSFFILAVVEPNSNRGCLTETKVKTGGEWACSFFDVIFLPLKIPFYD